MARLEGKLALVTGGGAGLGAAIARRFAGEGAEVIVNDVQREAAEAVAKEVGGQAIVADVADSGAVRGMFEAVAERFGRLDVLVNNAGIGIEDEATQKRFNERGVRQAQEAAAGGPVETHWDFTVELSDADWHRMIGVHLDGTFFCTREALKIMGPQGSGVILNLGSVMGTTGGAGASHYCAAKGGILGFTRSLAREVVSRGIRVNAIAPGWIETAMTEPVRELRQLLELQTPMGRFGEPDDIAWAAVYLASEEAKFVTGQVLSPNGGFYMSQ
jgi:NAD(P)-dependent dehydrogenase (short-subunit alcohol dehydrogenase family)